jgi:hypothetical protein
MPPSLQAILMDLRVTIADISKIVEGQQARLVLAIATRDRGLRTLRSFCLHLELVEVERPRPGDDPSRSPSESVRFCLICGLMENGIRLRVSGDPDFATIRYERLTSEVRAVLPESALEQLMHRLNTMGRFDEFDDQGNWIGMKAVSAKEEGEDGEGTN